MDKIKSIGSALLGLAFLALAVALAIHDPESSGAIGMAAVSVTTILAGTNTFIGDVIATADADVAATITHGLSLGGTPLEVTATKLISFALAAEPGWSWAAPGATTCVGTKLATAGSGNAGAQQRVTIKTPHTIGR